MLIQLSRKCPATSFSLRKNFAIYNYPFKDYNSAWNKTEYVIKTNAVKPEVLQSFVLAHDYLKFLLSKQDLDNLAKITRPKLFQELKCFIQNVKNHKLEMKFHDNSQPYTNPDSFLKFDQLVGGQYANIDFSEYEITNLLEKKHFRKISFTSKDSLLKISSTSSIIVVDLLFNTNVQVCVIDPRTQNIVHGKAPDSLETCLLQFTTKANYQNEPMNLSVHKEMKSIPQDQLDFGWKLSNINELLEEKNYENILDLPPKES